MTVRGSRVQSPSPGGKVLLPVLALALILASDLVFDRVFLAVRGAVFDAYDIIWPIKRGPYETVVIDVDQRSLQNVRSWPWPRDQIAGLITAAHEARAIGIHLLMSKPDRLSRDAWLKRANGGELPDTDAVLADAMAATPVVLAAGRAPEWTPPDNGFANIGVVAEGMPDLPVFNGVAWPWPALLANAKGVGVINDQPQADGVVRSLPAAVRVGSNLVPGFSICLIAAAEHSTGIALAPSWPFGYAVAVGRYRALLDRDGGVRPRLPRRPHVPVISAADIEAGTIDRARFRDKIVLIGSTAADAASPLSAPAADAFGGIILRAETIESVLTDETLWRPGGVRWLERLLTLGLGGLMIRLGLARGSRASLAMFAGTALVLVVGSLLAFGLGNVLLDWTLPVAALAATLSGVFIAGFWDKSTRLTLAEAELAHARLRALAEATKLDLSLALEAARLASWRLDLGTGTIDCSPGFDAIMGQPGGSDGWTWPYLLDRVLEPDRPLLERAFAAARAGEGAQVEFRVREAAGAVRWIGLVGQPIRDAAGTVRQLTGIVSDTTGQRAFSARLQRAEKMHTLGLLAGGVAHNFNNLLTALIGNLELALRSVEPGSAIARPLDRALKAAHRGVVVTRDLLTFSRQRSLQPRPVETAKRLVEAIEFISDALPSEIVVTTDIPAELATVEIDPTELDLALLNLAVNARDAMPSGGRLTVAARNVTLAEVKHGIHGRAVEISVADTGTGIPAELLPHVFEPFVSGKEVGAGTGLGLAQVQGFAQESGGGVEIDSVLGQGVTVRLYLPAYLGLAPSAGRQRPPAQDAARVALVEPDAEVAQHVATLLDQAGHQVLRLDSAAAALDRLEAGDRVDLLLGDLAAKGMLAAARTIAAEFPAVRVLLTAGMADAGGKADAGAFPLLLKPYRIEELNARIETLLGLGAMARG